MGERGGYVQRGGVGEVVQGELAGACNAFQSFADRQILAVGRGLGVPADGNGVILQTQIPGGSCGQGVVGQDEEFVPGLAPVANGQMRVAQGPIQRVEPRADGAHVGGVGQRTGGMGCCRHPKDKGPGQRQELDFSGKFHFHWVGHVPVVFVQKCQETGLGKHRPHAGRLADRWQV